jgi:hypothetical protein
LEVGEEDLFFFKYLHEMVFLFLKFTHNLPVTEANVQGMETIFGVTLACHSSTPPHWDLVLGSLGESPGESPWHSHAWGLA